MKENYYENKVSQTKLWKKLLSIFLAVLMGFSTFMTMTFGNLFLSDYVDFMSLIKAEAAISPVPLFYRYGELVGLYKLDYTNNTAIQYKIGEDGDWTDYAVPFSIPAFQTTKVYARIGENGRITYLNLSTTNEAIGVYTEGNTDFEFSYNNIDFGYTRIYNSADKDWFESIHSKVLVTNSRLEVQLPDSSKYPMIRKDADTYVDELNGYVLTKTDKNYIFDTGAYKYYFEIKALQSIAYLSAIEDYSGNRLNLSRTTSTEEISISDGAGRSFALSDYRGIEAPDGSGVKYYSVKEITDPNGNKLEYTTKLGRYIKVTDQAGVTLGQYEYTSNTTDYTLIRSMDKSISYYDNGRVKRVTYDNGSYITYNYDDAHMTYTTLTSGGEATKTVYNDAFLPVEYTDEYGQITAYTYDSQWRVVTETTDGTTTTYTYDDMGNVLSSVTEDAEDNSYYTYDEKGNVIREQNGDSYTYYTYDDNNYVLVSAALKEDYDGEIPNIYNPDLTCFDKTEYTYDSNGRVVEENSSDGYAYKYEYDTSGNVIKETTVITDNEETTTTVTSYTYDTLGNVLTTACESDTASYVYDNAGRTLLAKEGDSVTRTLYDDLGRVVQEISAEDYDSTKDGLPAENTYSDPTAGQTYVYAENGNLASETNRLGVTTNYQYNDVGAKIKESFDIYEFNYTDDGNPLNVKIGGAETISYTYDDSGNLVSESYANGDSIRYEYDNNGNVMYQYHNDDTEPYAVFGFSDDNILQGKFSLDSDLYTFYKDDGTIETYRYSDESLVMSYDRKITDADEENNIDRRTDISETHFGKNYTSVIKDNSIRYSHGNKSYEYSVTENDNYQIVSENINAYGIDAISSSYEYDENDNIIQKTINSIENTITINNAYDSKGRIIETSYNHANPVKFSYADEQLSRTDCKLLNYSELYTYDSRGNILSAEVYDYTNGDIVNQTPKETTQFYYENDGWSDRLLDVNGNALTYDANGNVLSYGDRTFTWNTGRHLESITDVENEYTYTYDENGIRTSKTVNGVTTYYNTMDGIILSQTDGTNTMYFQYDEHQVPIGFIYNGNQYYYMSNISGDIIGITESNGLAVAEYFYDAWGNVEYVEAANAKYEAVANANPLRYRGYYLDSETGYYYLQSRYYDPSICRFINADIADIAYECREEILGINLFAYCCNTPVNQADYDGYWGAVVHNGYNPNTSTKYNNVKVNNKTYFYGTYYWAIQCGFSKKDAISLGKYCNALDKDYPSTSYALFLAFYNPTNSILVHLAKYKQLEMYKSWQYYHFNGYERGNDDTRYEYACQKRREAVKYWKSNHDYALKMLGYALHAIQDMCAHGQIDRGKDIPEHLSTDSKKPADTVINYVWTNSAKNRLKKKPGDISRLLDTQRLTYTFLKAFLGGV